MALTTATTLVPDACTAATRRATLLMRSALATEVPPYFWTMRPGKEGDSSPVRWRTLRSPRPPSRSCAPSGRPAGAAPPNPLPVAAGVYGDAVEADLVVEVGAGADAAVAAEGDGLALGDAVPRLDQVAGEVAVQGEQTVLVAQLDGVTVARARSREDDGAIGGRHHHGPNWQRDVDPGVRRQDAPETR